MKSKAPSLGTFHWHNAAQFGGALNDNLFKLAVIYAMVNAWPGRDRDFANAVVGAVFAIPFLVFIGAAGVLADRVRKHRIVRGIKLAEIGVMAFGAAAVYLEHRWMLLAGVFFMSVQSALFSPTKFGIIPELVRRGDISRANSQMQAASYLAMILGTILAPFFSRIMGSMAGLASVGVAVAGWLAATRIAPVPHTESTSRASVFFLRDIFRTLKWIHKDAYLALAAWSAAFFLLIAAFIQLNLLSYGPVHLGMASQEEATFLFVMVAVGIGLGSLAAGRVSRRGIEFGIIPVGSLLMAAGCIGLWLTPGTGVAYGLCGVMGFGAGLFVVPVQSFLQYRSPSDRVGEIIAASGWLSWLGVLIAAGLLHLCASVLGLTPAQGFLFIGALILGLAAAAFVALPDFFVRFIAMALTRCFYRLRWTGLSRLPAQGGGLLVANHVSMMDALWISAMLPRRVRFVISRAYLEQVSPWMRGLLKLGRVIPMHEDDGPKALLKSFREAGRAIDEGYLVAIFPEGRLSRTGHMLPFKPGFERILKGRDAPVIPLYIDGGYDSHAGYGPGAPRLLHPGDFRHPVMIAVGERLPGDTASAEVWTAVHALAHDAADARAEVRGSAGRCLVRNAKRNWTRPAVTDSGGKTLTFGNTLVASLLLRKRLEQQLAGDPEEVGVLLPPSIAGALVNLSLAMGFRVGVNLNYTASGGAQQSAMEQAGVRTLITSKRFLEKFPDTPLPGRALYAEDLLTGFSRPAKLLAWLKAKALPTSWLVRDRWWRPGDPLTILFSSGSTAQPKGIVLSHHNILSDIDGFNTVARPEPRDCLCSVLPFFHSFGYTAGLWFPLTRGVTVAYHHHPLETDAIGALAKENRATILMGTPTFLTAWIRKIDPDCFTHLRWVVVGAEKLRPKVADMFERRFDIRPLEGYGATECAPVIAVNVPDVEIDGFTQTGTRPGSVGRPLPNIQTRVVDPETGAPRTTGEEGLLHVKGPNVMTGYLNNPEKTADVLRDGWYNTGDIVKIDPDGFITITDRLTRFSKLAGEMVSHSAVEEALHRAVGCSPDQLAVTGVSDPKKGERLVVIHRRDLGSPEHFREAVRSLDIPNLWKPDTRAWIPVDELPTLGTGKLDLKGLKRIAHDTLGEEEAN